MYLTESELTSSKKISMTKIILKKDKISKNEYFVVDDPTFVMKSTSDHLIVTTSQWSDNKNTLLKKRKILV